MSQGKDLTSSFRAKANYMKAWKPASTPSNRDRLELYALHKQSVSGNAPTTLPKHAQERSSPAEKAKYNAWKSKSGLSQQDAMRMYIQESDRQVRVYGSVAAATTPEESTVTTTPSSNSVSTNSHLRANGNGSVNGRTPLQHRQQHQRPQPRPHYSHNNNNAPRGLAAIPLLCAAASESRAAYLHRIANTAIENSWWNRQEPLCAYPSTIWSMPEYIIISIAIVVERVSVLCNTMHTMGGFFSILPPTSIQSFLWPLHNTLLSLWMGIIIIQTSYTCIIEYFKTVLFGARTSGNTLQSISDKILLSSDSVYTMTEIHQPLSARVVGLILLPYTTNIHILTWIQQYVPGYINPLLVFAAMYIFSLSVCSWWYWLFICPWFFSCLLGLAFLSGNCFALIDMAGM